MKRYFLVVFWVMIFFGLNASGQTEADGTIIVFNASEKEIVVAADSRISGRFSYVDDNCKIAAFGNKIIFAASGRAGPRNKPTELWDAYAIAKGDFKRLAKKTAPDELPQALANAWLVSIKHKINDRLSHGIKVMAGLSDNAIMSALFAGVKKDGSVLAVSAQITYDIADSREAINININYPPPYILSGTDFPNWMGRHEVIDELKARQTFRSDQWTRTINVAVKNSSDPIATVAIEKVKLTIDNLPKTKTTARGVPFSEVGNPISAVRLSRKGVEWIKKGNCPQD